MISFTWKFAITFMIVVFLLIALLMYADLRPRKPKRNRHVYDLSEEEILSYVRAAKKECPQWFRDDYARELERLYENPDFMAKMNALHKSMIENEFESADVLEQVKSHLKMDFPDGYCRSAFKDYRKILDSCREKHQAAEHATWQKIYFYVRMRQVPAQGHH